MKLKIYNPDSCPVLRSSKPAIHLNIKSGLLMINKGACDEIKLGGGDKVIFHQDEAEPENWYLQNTGKKGNGFEVREKNATTGVCFNNTSLARAIADSVSYTGISGRILIGEKITVKSVGDLYTLVTAGLRNK